MRGALYVCGGSDRLEERAACPDPLHDHPLPEGYLDATERAQDRLGQGWRNRKCTKCGRYGWTPPAGGQGD